MLKKYLLYHKSKILKKIKKKKKAEEVSFPQTHPVPQVHASS